MFLPDSAVAVDVADGGVLVGSDAFIAAELPAMAIGTLRTWGHVETLGRSGLGALTDANKSKRFLAQLGFRRRGASPPTSGASSSRSVGGRVRRAALVNAFGRELRHYRKAVCGRDYRG